MCGRMAVIIRPAGFSKSPLPSKQRYDLCRGRYNKGFPESKEDGKTHREISQILQEVPNT